MFFLALVRALERRTTVRVVVLGMAAGFTLMTRQEIGLVQTALATTLMALAPSLASGTHVRGTVMSGAWAAVLVILGLVTAVAPVVVYYQVQGALPDLVAAVFGQAVSYSNRPPLEFLRLIDPRTLGSALEGRGVGFLLLVPLVLFVVVIAQLVRALRLRPLTPQTLVAAALVVHAVPAFVQGYNPPLLIRYLQSAMVVYLLAVWVIGSLDGRTRQTAMGVAILVLVLQTVGVVVGFERVNPSGVYTGSLRLLSYRTPVRILGDTVVTDEVMAREIAFAREFFGQNTRPAEPIFAAPLHSLWYVLLERTNPTAFLGDFGHVAMSVQRKEQEMARLVASDTRYALVDRAWWHFGPRPDRPMLNTLATVFRPVATFGSLVILERRVPTPHVS
jgi:hypothetical protein